MAPTENSEQFGMTPLVSQEERTQSLSEQLAELRKQNQAELDKLKAEDEANQPSTFTKIAQAIATIGIPTLIGAAMGGKNGATLGAGAGGTAYGQYLSTKHKEEQQKEEGLRKARLESLKNTQKALQDTLLLPDRERIKAQAQIEAFASKMPLYQKFYEINSGRTTDVSPEIRDAVAENLVNAGVVDDLDRAREIASTDQGVRLGGKLVDDKNATGGLDIRKDKLEMEKAKSIIGPGVVVGENAAFDPKEAPKIRIMLGKVAGLQNHIKLLKQGFKENAQRNGGKINYFDDPDGKLGITYKQLFGKINDLNGYGKTLTGNEYPLISGQVPAMPDSSKGIVDFARNETFGRNPIRMLDTLSANLRSDTRESLIPYSIGLVGERYTPDEIAALRIPTDSEGRALPQDTSGFLTSGQIANRNRGAAQQEGNPGHAIVQQFMDDIKNDPRAQPGKTATKKLNGRTFIFRVDQDKTPIFNPEDSQYLQNLMGAHGR